MGGPPRIKQVHPGERYGRGVVIAEITLTRRSKPWRGVLLQCDCGTLYETAIYDLLRDRYPTRSCGCLYKDRGRSQGLSRTSQLYGTWVNMMARCYNVNVPSYQDYGARGITVCDRWHDARVFIEDIETSLGPRPPGMTLDRTDNDSDYAPGKVRWASRAEQNRNSRRFIDGTRNGPVYQLWWRLMRKYPDETCLRWHDFPAFTGDIKDLLGSEPWPRSMRFVRIDTSLPYGPGNVRWITGAQQIRPAQAARWAHS